MDPLSGEYPLTQLERVVFGAGSVARLGRRDRPARRVAGRRRDRPHARHVAAARSRHRRAGQPLRPRVHRCAAARAGDVGRRSRARRSMPPRRLSRQLRRRQPDRHGQGGGPSAAGRHRRHAGRAGGAAARRRADDAVGGGVHGGGRGDRRRLAREARHRRPAPRAARRRARSGAHGGDAAAGCGPRPACARSITRSRPSIPATSTRCPRRRPRTALALLASHLVPSLDTSAIDDRLRCQTAAWMSVQGIAYAGLGLSHALGHQIGPRWNVAHGVTSCITLPHAMRAIARKRARRASRPSPARFACRSTPHIPPAAPVRAPTRWRRSWRVSTCRRGSPRWACRAARLDDVAAVVHDVMNHAPRVGHRRVARRGHRGARRRVLDARLRASLRRGGRALCPSGARPTTIVRSSNLTSHSEVTRTTIRELAGAGHGGREGRL